MTQEEILQYNKRCALFLGMNNDAFLLAKQIEKNTGLCHLRFHSDWNWIMEVVEAIEKIFHIQGVEINGKWCCIKTNTFHEYRGVNKKEAVVEAINQFLIWYEQNKTI